MDIVGKRQWTIGPWGAIAHIVQSVRFSRAIMICRPHILILRVNGIMTQISHYALMRLQQYPFVALDGFVKSVVANGLHEYVAEH